MPFAVPELTRPREGRRHLKDERDDLLILSPLRREIRPAMQKLGEGEEFAAPHPLTLRRYRIGERSVLIGWTGMGPTHTTHAIASLSQRAPRAILHLGIAGALRPEFTAGDVVVLEGSHLNGHSLSAPPQNGMLELLTSVVPTWQGDSVSVSEAIRTRDAKLELASRYPDALVVEMESYWALESARQLGVPITCVRVVCDPLGQNLPDLAGALDSAGRPRPLSLARRLVTSPRAVRALPRLAVSFARAQARLRALVLAAVRG